MRLREGPRRGLAARIDAIRFGDGMVDADAVEPERLCTQELVEVAIVELVARRGS